MDAAKQGKTMKLRLTGKELRAVGLPEGPVISIAMNIMEKNYKHHTQEEALDILKNIVSSPADYINDEVLGMIAKQLIKKSESSKTLSFGEGLGEVALNE